MFHMLDITYFFLTLNCGNTYGRPYGFFVAWKMKSLGGGGCFLRGLACLDATTELIELSHGQFSPARPTTASPWLSCEPKQDTKGGKNWFLCVHKHTPWARLTDFEDLLPELCTGAAPTGCEVRWEGWGRRVVTPVFGKRRKRFQQGVDSLGSFICVTPPPSFSLSPLHFFLCFSYFSAASFSPSLPTASLHFLLSVLSCLFLHPLLLPTTPSFSPFLPPQ